MMRKYDQLWLVVLIGLFTFLDILLLKHLTTLAFQKHQSVVASNTIEPSAATHLNMPTATVPKQVSLDVIFDDKLDFFGNKSWKLVVGGDYNPGRHVNVVATHQDNFGHLLEHVGGLFKEANLALVNLEGALVANCPLLSEGMKFCGNVRHIEALNNVGIDIVSLANNHSLNFGKDGLLETKDLLTQHSVLSVGFDEIIYTQVENQTQVAIIGIDATLTNRTPQEIASLIASARQQSPVVIPYFHWGNEYTHDPSRNQRELAHAAIESGATLVLGSHPHWVQAAEIYNNTIIVYSHGNLVFDQFWSEKTRQGVLGEYIFFENTVIDARFLPIYIGDGYKPITIRGESAREVVNQMLQASERIKAYE